MGIHTADQFDWTDAAVAVMKANIAAGISAAVTAARLGTTRNSVLGKTHRLGLSTPKPPQLWTAPHIAYFKERWAAGDTPEKIAGEIGRTVDAVKRQARRLKLLPRIRPNRSADEVSILRRVLTVPLQSTAELIDNVIPIGQRRTLLELTNSTCRWPIGEPSTPDFFFCGGDSDNEAGRVYCSYHTMIARQPSNQSVS